MSTNLQFISIPQRLSQFVLPALAIGLALLALGCGGSSSSLSSTAQGPGTTPKTVTQVKIGDAPADRVISFEVTVGPITATSTTGNIVSVLSGTRRVELSHLSGTNEPLALLDVPQGSYSGSSITVSNPEVSFINNLGTLVKLQPALNQAIPLTFNPALTVGASPLVVSIDLNAAKSLAFDARGNVTGVNLSASSFTVGVAPVTAEDHQGHDDGELEDTTGVITSISGSSFTLTVGQNGVPLVFITDANTEFDDGASLTVNAIVTVEGVTKSDGTLYAREVEGIEDSSGAEGEGVVTLVSQNPAQLTFVADHGTGSGMDDTTIGNLIVADVSNARYRVKKGNVATAGIGGLPSATFPFDATTVHAGQRIEVESVAAMTGTSITADKVKLQQQALVGAVSGLQGATTAGPVTFTLTVDSDSVFAMLSGKSSVTVYWQPGTDLHKLSKVNNGDTVRVRGLVFYTGTGFNMIARRIDQ
jgi:hypothetical protein